MKKTKIVATLGPATDSKQQIQSLIDAGVNAFRLNFSHSDYETHREVVQVIRSVSEEVAVMLDTKGPEIRIGEVEEGTRLEPENMVELTDEDLVGNSSLLPVSFDGLTERLAEGDEVLIDDGRLELRVVSSGKTVECEVVHGGEVGSGKAVNIPEKDIGLHAPTEKDKKDLEFAADVGFDYVSLSFVKKAEDVEEARQILESAGSKADLISKIEHLKAVENYGEILQVSDGIMVARGDLGVEASAAEVPLLQKDQIAEANRAGKPVITATQMLESMTKNPTATRAEASDVANAVMDGTDAVMLSGETAVGDYPVKTVDFMSEIIERAEEAQAEEVHHTVKQKSNEVAEIICKNAWQSARDLETGHILAHTSSGYTARKMSKYRPNASIMTFTDDEYVRRKMSLVWGVKAFRSDLDDNIAEMIENSTSYLFENHFVEKDDTLVVIAGVPTKVSGTTNTIQIRDVERVLED